MRQLTTQAFDAGSEHAAAAVMAAAAAAVQLAKRGLPDASDPAVAGEAGAASRTHLCRPADSNAERASLHDRHST